MSPYIKQMIDELGKSEEETTKVWIDSKKIAAETFGIEESEFTKREIEYTKELVREILGGNRDISLTDFLASDKSARDFIEEAVTVSGDMGIDNSITKKKDLDIPEEPDMPDVECKDTKEEVEEEIEDKNPKEE